MRKCIVCEESHDLIVLTPAGKGNVEFICAADFGYRLYDGSSKWRTESARVYVPVSLMGDFPDLMADPRTVYYSEVIE